MMFDKSPADPKSGSLVDNKAQADLSTISHAVEESKSNPDRDIANKASSIKLEFKNVNSEKVPSNVPTKLANFPSSPAAQNDAVATSSTDSTVAKENAGKTAQTNSAITPTKSENRAQSAREKQAANRKKAADMKRQSRPSRS
jgi:hypothetical protein